MTLKIKLNSYYGQRSVNNWSCCQESHKNINKKIASDKYFQGKTSFLNCWLIITHLEIVKWLETEPTSVECPKRDYVEQRNWFQGRKIDLNYFYEIVPHSWILARVREAAVKAVWVGTFQFLSQVRHSNIPSVHPFIWNAFHFYSAITIIWIGASGQWIWAPKAGRLP